MYLDGASGRRCGRCLCWCRIWVCGGWMGEGEAGEAGEAGGEGVGRGRCRFLWV